MLVSYVYTQSHNTKATQKIEEREKKIIAHALPLPVNAIICEPETDSIEIDLSF